MTQSTGSVNVTYGDGSVRCSLADLALLLLRGGPGAVAQPLGPQPPVLHATLAGLRSQGLPLCAQRSRAFQGGCVSALLVLPSPGAARQGAPAVGFFGVPPGVGQAVLLGLLIPAVQKVRAAVDSLPTPYALNLVLVQVQQGQAAGQGGGTDHLALNFEHIRD